MTSPKEIIVNNNVIISKTTKSLIVKEEIEKRIYTSKILKKNITGYQFTKKSKSNNQLFWSIAGIITALITWQISSTTFISIYGSILLVAISLFLYFDYVLQKDKIMIKIYLQGNSIEFQTENSEVDLVEDFLKKIN